MRTHAQTHICTYIKCAIQLLVVISDGMGRHTSYFLGFITSKEILVTDVRVTSNLFLLWSDINCICESPKIFLLWVFCFDETVPICKRILCIHCPGVTCGVVISVSRHGNKRGDSQFVNGLRVFADETLSASHQLCGLVE